MVFPVQNKIKHFDQLQHIGISLGIHNIIPDLEQASDIFSKRLIDDYLKANRDKYHVFLSETSETRKSSNC